MCALQQPQDGVVVKGESFDFETCEEIDLQNHSSEEFQIYDPQLKDDDIRPLCANLGRFKRLKTIKLVSRGM